MRNFLFCLIFYVFNFSCASALTGNTEDRIYSSENIDPKLLKEADIVIREKNTNVEVKSNSEIKISELNVITILNNRGRRAATLVIPYSAFSEISAIEVEIYNSLGQLVRKIKKDEIQDVSGNSSWSLFSDNRYKIIEANYNNLPFTIKYSYKENINGFITPPDWNAIYRTRTSIENASLKVDIDISSKLLFKDFNLPACNIYNTGKSTSYSWNISGFIALPDEDNIPGSIVIFPSVLYYPEEFKIDKNIGSFSSWSEFGKFYYQLNDGADVLNDDAKKEIQNLISGKMDSHEKIKSLYHWMQSQTRYVAITQGIGGWKSFDANYVFKNKFGDCKALVNYMKAVLNSANITAYPVLIDAGSKKSYFDKEVTYNYFNHVILAIPLEKDTVWLECTDQKQPFNYLGSFTSDRYGLMVKEKDCRLVRTPSFDSRINQANLSGEIYISEAGTSKCKIKLIESGELHDETQIVQSGNSEDEKKNWLHSRIAVKDYKFISINYIEADQDTPLTRLDIELESTSIGGISGNRIFIHPKLLNVLIDDFPSENTRYFPLEFYPEAIENNSLVIHLPQNYSPESIDKKEIVKSDIGEYEYSLSYDKNSGNYILTEKFLLRKKTIAPEKYKDWLDFRNKVIALKNRSIVCKHI